MSAFGLTTNEAIGSTLDVKQELCHRGYGPTKQFIANIEHFKALA
jgi:hypothetical protein